MSVMGILAAAAVVGVTGIFVGLFFPITLWPVVVLVLFLQWLLKNKIIKSN